MTRTKSRSDDALRLHRRASCCSLQGASNNDYVETVLTHASGEFISEKLHIVPTKDDPQGLGSCITYARKYGLSAIAGIAPDDSDDDGEAAMGRSDVRRDQAARVAQSTQGKPQPISKSQDDF